MSESKSGRAAVLITLAIGVLTLGLLGQDAPDSKKAADAGAAQRRSPRWTGRIFRDSILGREFETFLGGELRFQDPQGKPLTVVAHPGKVTKLTAESITLELNDRSAAKDFPVVKADTDDGRELSRQMRRIRVGDRVLVININGETKWIEREPARDQEKEQKEKEEKEKKEKEEKEKKEKEAKSKANSGKPSLRDKKQE